MCTQPALVQWTVSTTAVTAVWLHCRYRALVHHLLFYPRAAPATASQQIASWKFASTSFHFAVAVLKSPEGAKRVGSKSNLKTFFTNKLHLR